MASRISSTLIVATLMFASVYATAPVIVDIETPLIVPEIKADADDYRLDNNDVQPTGYEITIVVKEDFAETMDFAGTVAISMKLKQNVDTDSTKPIFLHSLGLTRVSDSYKLELDGKGPSLIKAEVPMEQYDLLKFDLDGNNKIEKDKTYVFKGNYAGKIQTALHGLYISKYNNGGENMYLLQTQFEPTNARRLMPCFDEPGYKATFKMTLEYPNTYSALFNTPSEDRKILNNVVTETFKTTPKMSTYLLAIIISNLSRYTRNNNDIAHTVWGRDLGRVNNAIYPVIKSTEVIDVMNEYTKKNFKDVTEFRKIDHVALPDFASGAMENWGLVTYRESLLVYGGEEETTTITKQRICSIVAHELAHFWFGNLLTTKWWDNTWLNEGFARYFEYMAANEVENEWELDKQFIVQQHIPIMVADGSISTKPLYSEVNSPLQISQKFNTISYNKGATIIRMMSVWMGVEKFKQGLEKYFAKDSFGTVVPADLWTAMDGMVANLPNLKKLADIMTTYVTQAGVPVLNVEVDQQNRKKIKITQKRFSFTKLNNNEKLWYYIPITFTTSENDGPHFDGTIISGWLENKEESSYVITLVNDEDALVIVNIQAFAYARVNYDQALWGRIKRALKSENFGKIDEMHRAQIIDDLFNLARAGTLKYDFVLDIISYLENETSYYPWYSAFNGFQYLLRRLPSESAEATQLKRFITDLMNKVYTDNIPNENVHIKALKNSLTKSWRCNLGNQECINEMTQLFAQNRDNLSKLPPDIRSTAYCVALRENNPEDAWDVLEKRFLKTPVASEAQLILATAGCTKNGEILKNVLEETINKDSEVLRIQDRESVFVSVAAGSPEGLIQATEFFKKEHKSISDLYGGKDSITAVLNNLIDRFTETKQIGEFNAFLDQNDLLPFKDAAKEILKSAEANIEWTDKYKGDIRTYIAAYFKGKEGEPETTPPPPKPTPKPSSANSMAVSILLVVCNVLAVTYFS